MLEELPLTKKTVTQTVRRFNLGRGLTAAQNTIDLMADIINSSAQNYYVRNWAESMTRNVQARDYFAIVSDISQWIYAHSKYVRDVSGTEFIRTPVAMLQQIEAGDILNLDCDDFTVLSLSLFKSLGFGVAIRAAGYKSLALEHVYGLVQIRDKWYALDLTMPEGLGWEGANPLNTLTKVVT